MLNKNFGLIVFAFGMAALASQAYAGCEDGRSTAEQAVHTYLAQYFAKHGINRSANSCQIQADPNSVTYTSVGETWKVGAHCPGLFSNDYKVDLKEVGDAVCTVEGVTQWDKPEVN